MHGRVVLTIITGRRRKVKCQRTTEDVADSAACIKAGTSSTLEMLTTLYRARGVLAQPSVAGHYYMPLYEANMGRISELVSRDPTLAERMPRQFVDLIQLLKHGN